MGAAETAKEIARIATTAGLSKDVIDLLDMKASLLAGKVESLESDNANLTKKVLELTRENEALKRQLAHLQPNDDLLPQTKELLKHFFRVPGTVKITVPGIMNQFSWDENYAKYYLGFLMKKDFISIPGIVIGSGQPLAYKITDKGRAYCIETGLVD